MCDEYWGQHGVSSNLGMHNLFISFWVTENEQPKLILIPRFLPRFSLINCHTLYCTKVILCVMSIGVTMGLVQTLVCTTSSSRSWLRRMENQDRD